MLLQGASATRCLLNGHQYSARRLFSVTSTWSRTAGRKKSITESKDKWNYNTDPFDGIVAEDHHKLPLVDANKLETGLAPPVGVKMLVRDFIEDSLYNPNYGYFPKQATIFNANDTPFDFTTLRDSAEFQEEVASRYADYGADDFNGPGRQLWHTPTELFKVCRNRTQLLDTTELPT